MSHEDAFRGAANGLGDVGIGKELRPRRVVDDRQAGLARQFQGDRLGCDFPDRPAVEDAPIGRCFGRILPRDRLDFLQCGRPLDLFDLLGVVVAHDVTASSATNAQPSRKMT